MSEGMDWTRGGRVSRYSPIMDDQPSQSLSQGLKMHGMGEKRVDFALGSWGAGDANFAGSAEPGTEWDTDFTPARLVHQHGCP